MTLLLQLTVYIIVSLQLMREFIEREKRKQAEREAEKAAKKDSAAPAVAADGQPEKANA